MAGSHKSRVFKEAFRDWPGETGWQIKEPQLCGLRLRNTSNQGEKFLPFTGLYTTLFQKQSVLI
jgi:hypothetical protein